MGVETYLLGLRLFSPAPQVSDELEQVSTTLFLWVEAVLEEFGLSIDDIFAVVTDSGSDVKRCGTAKDLLNKPWAWCPALPEPRAGGGGGALGDGGRDEEPRRPRGDHGAQLHHPPHPQVPQDQGARMGGLCVRRVVVGVMRSAGVGVLRLLTILSPLPPTTLNRARWRRR